MANTSILKIGRALLKELPSADEQPEQKSIALELIKQGQIREKKPQIMKRVPGFLLSQIRDKSQPVRTAIDAVVRQCTRSTQYYDRCWDFYPKDTEADILEDMNDLPPESKGDEEDEKENPFEEKPEDASSSPEGDEKKEKPPFMKQDEELDEEQETEEAAPDGEKTPEAETEGDKTQEKDKKTITRKQYKAWEELLLNPDRRNRKSMQAILEGVFNDLCTYDDAFVSIALDEKQMPAALYNEECESIEILVDQKGNLGNDTWFCDKCPPSKEYKPDDLAREQSRYTQKQDEPEEEGEEEEDAEEPNEPKKDEKPKWKCPVHGIPLKETAYVQKVGDEITARWDKDEMIHIRLFNVTGRIYGTPPLLSLMTTVGNLLAMDSYFADSYTMQRAPRGFVVFTGVDQRSVTRQAREVEQAVADNPQAIGWFGLPEGKSVEFVNMMTNPTEMQSIDFYKLYTEQVYKSYHITPIVAGTVESGKSGNNPSIQLDVEADFIRAYQRAVSEAFNNSILPEKFGVKDWYFGFTPIETEEEAEEAMTQMAFAQVAKAWQDAGFDVALDEDNKPFPTTRVPKKPEPPSMFGLPFGKPPPFGNKPPGEQEQKPGQPPPNAEQMRNEGNEQSDLGAWKSLRKSEVDDIMKARHVEGFESPEPGDISEKDKEILANAYAACRDEQGGSEAPADKEKCAKIAWAAVHNAKAKMEKSRGWYENLISKGALTPRNQPAENRVPGLAGAEQDFFRSLQDIYKTNLGEAFGEISGINNPTRAQVEAELNKALTQMQKDMLKLAQAQLADLYEIAYTDALEEMGLKVEFGGIDETSLQYLEDSWSGVDSVLPEFSRDQEKAFSEIIDKAYRGEIPFSLDDMLREMREVSDSEVWKIARIVRSETTLIANNGRVDAWKKVDKDNQFEYEWSMAGDACDICTNITAGNPYRIDDLAEASTGTDGQPFRPHPNCRCTVVVASSQGEVSPYDRFARYEWPEGWVEEEKSLHKYGTHEGACRAVESRGATAREACGGSAPEKKPREPKKPKDTRGRTRTGKRGLKLVAANEDYFKHYEPRMHEFMNEKVIGNLPPALTKTTDFYVFNRDDAVQFANNVIREEGGTAYDEYDENAFRNVAAYHYHGTIVLMDEEQTKYEEFLGQIEQGVASGKLPEDMADVARGQALYDLYHEVGHVYHRESDVGSDDSWASPEDHEHFRSFVEDMMANEYPKYREQVQEWRDANNKPWTTWSAINSASEEMPPSMRVAGEFAEYASTKPEEFFAVFFGRYASDPTQFAFENPDLYKKFKDGLQWESPFMKYPEIAEDEA